MAAGYDFYATNGSDGFGDFILAPDGDSGTIYGSTSLTGGLPAYWTFDIASSVFTLISQTHTWGRGQMAADANGNVYSNIGQDLIRFDKATGNTIGTLIPTGVRISDLTGPFDVPQCEADFGDAPSSYDTDMILHFLDDDIFLGALVDKDDLAWGEDGIDDTQNASDDDNASMDDEDGVPGFPRVEVSPGDTYSVPNISVVNNTGQRARLCGWFDFDINGQAGDGEFENSSPGDGLSERACATVNGTPGAGEDPDNGSCTGTAPNFTCQLDFTVPNDFVYNGSAATFARFRVTTDASFFTITSPSPIGSVVDGEVEDFFVPIGTLPVTLSSISNELTGTQVKVDWTTSSELFNVGYQLWGLDGYDSKWEKLHAWLVRSGSGNAVEPQSYSRSASVPGSIKNLVAIGISSVDSDGSEHYYGPFELGQSYGNLSQLEPIAWDHIRDEVDKSMESKGYVKDRVYGYRKVSHTNNGADTEQVVELTVRESGMVRLQASELASAGLDLSGTKNRDIAIIDHTGSAVVRYVLAKGQGSGLNKTLGALGEVYFYASAPDGHAALYSEVSHYRIKVDSTRALHAPLQVKQGITGGYSSHYRERLLVEEDNQYTLSAQADDPWVERVMTAQPNLPMASSQMLTLPADVDQSRGVDLLIGVGRSSQLSTRTDPNTGKPIPEHMITAAVIDSNDSVAWLAPVGETGRGEWDVQLPIEVELGDVDTTAEGLQVNVGALFSVGSGYAFSVQQLDYMGVEYAREYTAKGDDQYLSFVGPDDGETGYQVVLPETGYALVFAYTKGNLVRLVPESQVRQIVNGQSQRLVTLAALNGTGTQGQHVHYWVSSKRGYLSPESLRLEQVPTKNSVLSQAQGANSLLIPYTTFNGAALQTYAQQQQSRGLIPAIVDYGEIVSAYGGQTGPSALTQYLSDVENTYGQLDYVLLVGSSVYDHLDRLGTGSMTFIPGHYGESNYSNFTVSDVPYVTDASGELFASIGRWPVRSDEELSAMIANSIDWSNRDRSTGKALLIAEQTLPSENIDFAAALDANLQPQLPANWSNHKIYVDKIIANDPSLTLTQALVRAKDRIITQLSGGPDGPDVVMYNGHATTSQLSNKGLFKASDVDTIDGSNASMWIPMSCYMTYYESTHVNTLAHQLMAKGKAVGITGAMLLSNQWSNITAGRSIVDGLLNDGLTLGEAVNKYKVSQNSSFRVNWSVLGDSSLKTQ